jgi:hypothetical protein
VTRAAPGKLGIYPLIWDLSRSPSRVPQYGPVPFLARDDTEPNQLGTTLEQYDFGETLDHYQIDDDPGIQNLIRTRLQQLLIFR